MTETKIAGLPSTMVTRLSFKRPVAFRPCFSAGLVFYITVDLDINKDMPQCGIRQVGVNLASYFPPVTNKCNI